MNTDKTEAAALKNMPEDSPDRQVSRLLSEAKRVMAGASEGIKQGDQDTIAACIDDLRRAESKFTAVMEWRRANGDADMVDARTGKRYAFSATTGQEES